MMRISLDFASRFRIFSQANPSASLKVYKDSRGSWHFNGVFWSFISLIPLNFQKKPTLSLTFHFVSLTTPFRGEPTEFYVPNGNNFSSPLLACNTPKFIKSSFDSKSTLIFLLYRRVIIKYPTVNLQRFSNRNICASLCPALDSRLPIDFNNAWGVSTVAWKVPFLRQHKKNDVSVRWVVDDVRLGDKFSRVG